MSKPATKNPLKHLRAVDLRAVAQLATQATAGVARMAEGVHQSVWGSMGVPGGNKQGTTRGLTGLIYQSVLGVTQLVGKGLGDPPGTGSAAKSLKQMLRGKPTYEILRAEYF